MLKNDTIFTRNKNFKNHVLQQIRTNEISVIRQH